MRYGDMAEADIIKIHKTSSKVTFLLYDDFDGKPLPELRQRTKVNLRTLFVQVFDYPESPQSQLLYSKERYLPSDHPQTKRMQKFSRQLRALGIDQTLGFGPTKDKFLSLAASHRAFFKEAKRSKRTPLLANRECAYPKGSTN
jgi:DNA phosphorothioation-associated putative methyltransferase